MLGTDSSSAYAAAHQKLKQRSDVSTNRQAGPIRNSLQALQLGLVSVL